MRLTESKVYIGVSGVSGYLATKEGQFLPKGGGGVGGKEVFVPCSNRVIPDLQSFVCCF